MSRPPQLPAAMDEAGEETYREWCEAVAGLVDLQRAQVLALGEDGGEHMAQLGDAFQVMATAIAAAPSQDAVDQLELARSMQAAVRTLQFADAQAQRLEHLARALDGMADLLRRRGVGDVDAWASLRGEIRGSYTMARECEVFDRTFRPGESDRSAEAATDAGPDIELF